MNPEPALTGLPSPAKINLFLHVTGQREDGYHTLETLFQFLAFGDVIDLALTDGDADRRIDRHDFDLPREDLVLRAARELRDQAGLQRCPAVTVTLHKQIPPGSGLGGGSSNAATVLLGLNRLWSLGLSTEELAKIGVQLGADVPVFIKGQAALARGIGEHLEPVTLAERWLCLCLPPVSVSTDIAFGDPGLVRDHAPSPNPLDETGNDLEAVVARQQPAIAEMLNRLRRYGDARMSGTGSAVFLLTESESTAHRVAAELPAGYNPRVTRTVSKHPLLDFGRSN